MLRQIPYDTWRKHYAKDKDGNYHGTHAPAEDCLLKPHDVEKWRFGDPVTKGDLWTRGKEALPVYAEVETTAAVPEYERDYDGPPRTEPGEHGLIEGVPDSVTTNTYDTTSRTSSTGTGQIIADGKTADEIIAEAKAKGKSKLTWKERVKRAAEITAMAADR